MENKGIDDLVPPKETHIVINSERRREARNRKEDLLNYPG